VIKLKDHEKIRVKHIHHIQDVLQLNGHLVAVPPAVPPCTAAESEIDDESRIHERPFRDGSVYFFCRLLANVLGVSCGGPVSVDANEVVVGDCEPVAELSRSYPADHQPLSLILRAELLLRHVKPALRGHQVRMENCLVLPKNDELHVSLRAGLPVDVGLASAFEADGDFVVLLRSKKEGVYRIDVYLDHVVPGSCCSGIAVVEQVDGGIVVGEVRLVVALDLGVEVLVGELAVVVDGLEEVFELHPSPNGHPLVELHALDARFDSRTHDVRPLVSVSLRKKKQENEGREKKKRKRRSEKEEREKRLKEKEVREDAEKNKNEKKKKKRTEGTEKREASELT